MCSGCWTNMAACSLGESAGTVGTVSPRDWDHVGPCGPSWSVDCARRKWSGCGVCGLTLCHCGALCGPRTRPSTADTVRGFVSGMSLCGPLSCVTESSSVACVMLCHVRYLASTRHMKHMCSNLLIGMHVHRCTEVPPPRTSWCYCVYIVSAAGRALVPVCGALGTGGRGHRPTSTAHCAGGAPDCGQGVPKTRSLCARREHKTKMLDLKLESGMYHQRTCAMRYW